MCVNKDQCLRCINNSYELVNGKCEKTAYDCVDGYIFVENGTAVINNINYNHISLE